MDTNIVRNSRPAYLIWLVSIFVLWTIAISDESLWIDEAVTAWQAGLPSLTACWQQQIADRGSELQMPLFMAYLWVWENLFGANEWSLRFSNLPWLLLGFAAWLKASCNNKKLQIGVGLVAAFSPFIWFYLNEARPYTMQLGGSFLVLASLYRFGSDGALSKSSGQRWAIALAAGMFIVCGSSLLGVLWVAAALGGTAMSIGIRPQSCNQSRGTGVAHDTWLKHPCCWDLLKSFPIIWLLAFIALSLLGIYFLWTFQQGARASGAAGTDFKNLLFIAYEFLGFTGLGPGRLELREAGIKSLRPYAPLFAIYAAVLAAIALAAWRGRSQLASPRKLLWPAAFLAAATVTLLLMGNIAHFRVLGRHFAPLIVIVLVWLGFGLSQLMFRSEIFPKVVAALFIGLNLFSCFSLRFADRHRKDDYRNAANIAKNELAARKTVWWNADLAGALHYRLPVSKQPSPQEARRRSTALSLVWR